MFWETISRVCGGAIIILVCLFLSLADFDKISHFLYFVGCFFIAIIILGIVRKIAINRIRLDTALNIDRIRDQYKHKVGLKGGY